MERTYTDDGVIYIGELEITRLLVQLIKQHKFLHNNECPQKIVFPVIKGIEGVTIEQASEPDIMPLLVEPRKKKGVKRAACCR